MPLLGGADWPGLFLQPREKGRMRFHKLQNVQIALDYLRHRQVRLPGWPPATSPFPGWPTGVTEGALLPGEAGEHQER